MTVGECNSSRMETLIINLSDDVLIDTIMVSNHEDFSSPLGQVKFYGSIINPPSGGNWRHLGTLNPKPDEYANDQILLIENAEEGGQGLVRYIRVEMTGQERNDNGLYCTLTRI